MSYLVYVALFIFFFLFLLTCIFFFFHSHLKLIYHLYLHQHLGLVSYPCWTSIRRTSGLGDLTLLFYPEGKLPLIPNNCMLNIYYCLSTVSWKGYQGFHKGVVKSTFPFSIYQQPCNSGGLKYGQSSCYSTSPGGCCSLTLHTDDAPHPLPVKQCEACWRIRHV